LLEQLKEEEAKAKDMLDAKINCEQETEIVEEDAGAMKNRRLQNREDLIRTQIRNSQLLSNNARVNDEYEQLLAKNEALLKANDEVEVQNEKLNNEIIELVQRIDVNTLLKEVDLEELHLLANNNTQMNMGFMKLLTKWEAINSNND
jgi:hypothetical protein